MRPERRTIWWADLPGLGRKPVVIVSSNRLNFALTEVVVARITSIERERSFPTAVALGLDDASELTAPSWVLTHSLWTVPLSALRESAGRVRESRMREIEHALAWTFNLTLA